ncbi:MAG TPA: hypothetical protein VFW70_17915 [Methylomirabilota bacterium]|nr:hypothetical protein [Methylomirabilota bacterium]
MLRSSIGAALALGLVVTAVAPAVAEPIAVRYTEGVTRGFPVLRSLAGEKLAQGELTQVARGDIVESRLVFRFKDGSLYDERVTFSQKDVFTLLRYHIVQQGPSFPESIEGRVDRRTGEYEVKYKGDEESPEETLRGSFDMPGDVYNGMLSMLMKNMPAATPATVQIVAFTPKPRLVKMLLKPVVEDPMSVNDAAVMATRFLVRPQLGLLASLLVADIPDVNCWIAGGDAPAFLRFEGPLYFMGPIWRIDWS